MYIPTKFLMLIFKKAKNPNSRISVTHPLQSLQKKISATKTYKKSRIQGRLQRIRRCFGDSNF